MFGLTFRTNMANFDTVEDLIAACKTNNSMLWMKIKDLEKDYQHNRSLNDTVEKLEEIFDTLDALNGVV
jgi:hypothetical protein